MARVARSTVARLARLLRGAAFAALVMSGSARADDPWELWPELNLFERLGSRTRLYFVAAFAKGKESELRTLDLAGCFDLTIGPFLRPALRQDDWKSRRYLWVRIGYDHVFKQEGDTKSAPEDRGILALHGRAYLPAGILFEGRARTDLRWIDGDYSTRYRFRIEVNRDFEVRDRVVTPYFQAEWFYDTRYDGWARELYQVGAEVEIAKHFRAEPYVARQLDRLPDPSGLYAVGVVARWYY